MRSTEAINLFRQITEKYFESGATVVMTRQRGMVKPPLGLVSLGVGPVRRTYMPGRQRIEAVPVDWYPSQTTITVDLFTHGRAVRENGEIIGYENTAVDDLCAFADYLNSAYVEDICNQYNLTIITNGEIQDLSGVVNDVSYEYRAQLEVALYYTHRVAGRAAVLSEDSIRNSPSGAVTIDPVLHTASAGGGSEELASEAEPYFEPV